MRKEEIARLPGFETVEQCQTRQGRMLKLMTGHGVVVSRSMRRCTSRQCAKETCPDACHFATRKARLVDIKAGVSLFESLEPPLRFISLVRDAWVQDVGQLAQFDLDEAKAWVKRRIAETNAVAGIFAIEATLNADTTGEVYWAVGVHGLVAGATRDEVFTAIREKSTRRFYRPLVVQPVNNIARQLGYLLKRFPQERRQYRGRNGRLARKLVPLRPDHQVEFDTWLMSLEVGERMFLLRCRRTEDGFALIHRRKSKKGETCD